MISPLAQSHNLVFEYALQYPNGSYYTGRVTSDREPHANEGTEREAFTYTEKGAYVKRDSHWHFHGCTVKKII